MCCYWYVQISRLPPTRANQHNEKVVNKAVEIKLEVAHALHQQALTVSQEGGQSKAADLLYEALRKLPIASPHPGVIPMRIRILVTLAFCHAETGSLADGLVQLGTAGDLISAVANEKERLSLSGLVIKQHGLLLLRAGRTADAVDKFSEAIPILAMADDRTSLVSPLINRANAYIALGWPAEAERDMRRCIELTTELNLPVPTAKAQSNLGDIAQLTGDIPDALANYEAAERSFRDVAPGLVPRTQIDRSRALLAAGLADEAAKQLDDALSALSEQRIGQDLAEAEVARAAAALLLGDLTTARALAGVARRRFLKRGNEPWAEVAALTKMRADVLATLAGTAKIATPAKEIGRASCRERVCHNV